jgi:hypothetical protein
MPSRRNGLTRRALVAATALGAGGSALAQRPPQPPRVKGPLVWLDMDQQDLDDAYDQLVYAPNRDYILKRCARNSELARERLGAPKRFAYGATPIEALDVFTTKVANAPVSVFVHGGAWRTGLAINYAYAAEMFVNAGAHHVVLDSTTCSRPAAISWSWPTRCAAPSPGSTAMPRASAATESGSMSAATPPADISPACC